MPNPPTYPGEPCDDGDKTVEEKLGTTHCEAGEKKFALENPGKTVQIKKIKVRDVMRSSPARFDETGKQGRQLTPEEWKGIIHAMEAHCVGWTYQGAGPNACCCTWA